MTFHDVFCSEARWRPQDKKNECSHKICFLRGTNFQKCGEMTPCEGHIFKIMLNLYPLRDYCFLNVVKIYPARDCLRRKRIPLRAARPVSSYMGAPPPDPYTTTFNHMLPLPRSSETNVKLEVLLLI